jgi:hypothetical protein
MPGTQTIWIGLKRAHSMIRKSVENIWTGRKKMGRTTKSNVLYFALRRSCAACPRTGGEQESSRKRYSCLTR